jgi:hypothetical protein
LSWYFPWLSCQLENLPKALQDLRVGGEALTTIPTVMAIYSVTEAFIQGNQDSSIDEIIEHLLNTRVFKSTKSEDHALYRVLVFAILGWRSMVYLPAFNVRPPSELAIYYDSNQPDSGLVFDTYTVPADFSDRPLYILLKAFGNLLPARSPTAPQIAVETTRVAASWTALYPADINAHLLDILLRVRFRWVDTLALHLDYDKSTRTLCLFAFPSMCVEMLRSHGPIFAFASTERNAVDPRADEKDIEKLLQEVLLSYRLLFGQSARARRLFRRMMSGGSAPPFPQPDTLLALLCASKNPNCGGDESIPEDRTVYFAHRDFCVLRERIELLAKELEQVRPRSMGDLVRDNRDKLQYWTFWLVSIIGGISVLLSLAQVILQAIDVWK